jgi:hypothetical protein
MRDEIHKMPGAKKALKSVSLRDLEEGRMTAMQWSLVNSMVKKFYLFLCFFLF